MVVGLVAAGLPAGQRRQVIIIGIAAATLLRVAFALVTVQLLQIVGLVLARRAGWPAPLILRKRSDIEAVTSILGGGRAVDPIMGDFESGNIVVKVADVFGTYVDGTNGNWFDFRGGYYSTGTAP